MNQNQLLHNTFLFIIPIVIFIFVIEQLYKQIPNNYSMKIELLEQKKEEIEILVLGSSHAYRGINPQFFDLKCFNMSMVSQSLDYDYLILEKYLPFLPKLKYVILPISYFTLTKKMCNGPEYWRNVYYTKYYGINNISPTDWFSLESRMLLWNKTGHHVVKSILKYYFEGSHFVQCNEDGWGKYTNNLQIDLESSATAAARRHEVSVKDKLWETEPYLDKIIQLSISRDVKVILYSSPASEFYYPLLNQQVYNRNLAYCEYLAKQYSDVIFLNYAQSNRFPNDLFKDGDHLNATGARQLSLMLNYTITTFREK